MRKLPSGVSKSDNPLSQAIKSHSLKTEARGMYWKASYFLQAIPFQSSPSVPEKTCNLPTLLGHCRAPYVGRPHMHRQGFGPPASAEKVRDSPAQVKAHSPPHQCNLAICLPPRLHSQRQPPVSSSPKSVAELIPVVVQLKVFQAERGGHGCSREAG